MKGWLGYRPRTEVISWDQLSDWLDFTNDEPIGEERDDLRIGALGTIFWNANLDTKKSGVIKADRYGLGWGTDKIHRFGVVPGADREKDRETEDRSLNNPAVWNSFKESFKK